MRSRPRQIARRVISIQESDLLTLTRAGQADPVTISWKDAGLQIVQSVAQARQAMVDRYDEILDFLSQTLDWTQQELDDKASINHTHTMAQIVGLVDALSGKATPADVQAAINALIAASPGALDTLKELADAIGNDPHFSVSITNLISQKATPADIAAAIAAEVAARNSAVTAGISAEVTARDAAIASAISAEVTARNNAITSAINAETAARVYANTQEAQARIAADNALQTAINAKPGKFVATFGNGILTSFDFTHNLNTMDVIVQVYSNATLALITPATVTRLDVNRVRLTFLLAVGNNANRVVIFG